MPSIGASLMLMLVFWVMAKIAPELGWVLLALVLVYLIVRLSQASKSGVTPVEMAGATPNNATASTADPKPKPHTQRKKRRRPLHLDQTRVSANLQEYAIGQDGLAQRVATDLEAHFMRKPRKPFSLLVTGLNGTGRASIADALAQTIAQIANDSSLTTCLRVQCTVDTRIDLEALTASLRNAPGKVVHLADIEHQFPNGFEMNSFAHALVSMLTNPALAQNIIVLTSTLAAAPLVAKLDPETAYDGRVSALVRDALGEHLGVQLLNVVSLLSATRVLTDDEKCRVVWQLLAGVVGEYGLVLEDPVSPQDRERCMALMHRGAQIWREDTNHGRVGVEQWLARKASPELVRAKKAGKSGVFARWHADSEHLQLI
ncbi:MAG: hypothetical protein AB8G17_21555 [Gammaproteobacteria bacterium]